MKFILASASPRRRQLLRKAGLSFRVLPSHVPETSSQRKPILLVRQLALRKAKATSRLVNEGVVIGADTVVVLKGRILGKPRNVSHASRMLADLSGSTHHVYTGVAVVDAANGKSVVDHERSAVRMKPLSPELLRRLSRLHHDKAGAYAIQEKKDPIARVIKGSYDNVVGLPVATVRRLLRKLSRDA